ncbi:MAG: phosphoribosylformylglycinamidine cyclo-ligase [Deltaproteobacteria bacterium]|nr:phosphoribosylformylglycinamidine cyclo-ligase [Deltaproteobacteria bacterium]
MADPNKPGLTYRDAGVDIDAGNLLVDRIKTIVKRTHRPEVLSSIGGFAGLCGLPGGYRNPVLAACTDGVGTKLKLAFLTGKHNTVGIDLVAMSVNDLIVCGAQPLFFLDYFACGRLQVGVAEQVIAGIGAGCETSHCALLGGETAELPGFYADGEYDLAGFCVGVVEKDAALDGSQVQAGDVLLGLASSGFHSNGYSLVRKVFLESAGLALDARLPGVDLPLGEALLTPTRIYVDSMLALYNAGMMHAASHITGGGLVENPPRMLGKDAALSLRIDRKSWTLPPLFAHLQRLGNVDPMEMLRTFNAGIGMVIAVPAARANEARTLLQEKGETVYTLGEVIVAKPGSGVEFVG